jgi:hypothetical protein
MASNELDRLRALANFADQICSLAESSEDARRRINQLISRAEQDIKSKSLEIQLQQSHIALLKQLEGFMTRPPETDVAKQIRFSEKEPSGPRAVASEGNSVAS